MIVLTDPTSRLPAIRLEARRSIRDLADRPVSIDDLGTLLFAMQGRRRADDKRLTPSAGARYPLTLTVAVRRVATLSAGLYRYDVERHALDAIDNDAMALSKAAAATFEAPWVAEAALALHISAAFEKTTIPYADQPPAGRAERYVWLEAGHVAQNAALTAAALDLATVLVAGFDDAAMGRAFCIPPTEKPVGLMPVGYPKAG